MHYVDNHPLVEEFAKLQAALEACPPLWWADELLWRGLKWFYGMRQRRVREAWDGFASRKDS